MMLLFCFWFYMGFFRLANRILHFRVSYPIFIQPLTLFRRSFFFFSPHMIFLDPSFVVVDDLTQWWLDP